MYRLDTPGKRHSCPVSHPLLLKTLNANVNVPGPQVTQRASKFSLEMIKGPVPVAMLIVECLSRVGRNRHSGCAATDVLHHARQQWYKYYHRAIGYYWIHAAVGVTSYSNIASKLDGQVLLTGEYSLHIRLRVIIKTQDSGVSLGTAYCHTTLLHRDPH
jgi:hypothetical protein